MTEQASTELALPTITPEQYPELYVSGGLDQFYQQIREQVMSEVPDLATKKGIARIKSLAASVSTRKMDVVKPGRDYLRVIKAKPKLIEAVLRDFEDKMDALRDEVRQPVTELEENEKARIAALDQRIVAIQSFSGKVTNESPSSEIKLWISELEAIAIDGTWSEYKERAQVAKDAAAQKLNQSLQSRLTWEAQQAEIARLKEEREEQERIQREKEIADRARHEAEQKALREKLESEQREQAAKDALLKAEQDARDAKLKAEQDAKDAAERAELATKRALEQERQRQIDEQNRIAQEDEQRKADAAAKAANIEHQKLINNEILDDMQAYALSKGLEVSRDTLRIVLAGMVFGKVRHTQVQY